MTDIEFYITCAESTRDLHKNCFRTMLAIFIFIIACGLFTMWGVYVKPNLLQAGCLGAIIVNLVWIFTHLLEYRTSYSNAVDRLQRLNKLKDEWNEKERRATLEQSISNYDSLVKGFKPVNNGNFSVATTSDSK